MKLDPSFEVAVAHVAPVLLDTDKTIEKVCSIVREAAGNGARLISFPETYVSAFPVWSALRAPIYNHELFGRLVESAIGVESVAMDRVRKAARENGMIVSLGFNERSGSSVGCVYNSNVLIDRDGSILNHHRKIVPTFYEKLTWSPGDGAGLRVCDTDCGRVGMLICGENTNPLARFSLIAQAEQIHISSYPPIWPTHPPADGRNYDLAGAIRLRAGNHSFEAKAFNLVSSSLMDEAMFKFLVELDGDAAKILAGSGRGVSMVTGPSGERIGEELCNEEGILYADIDLNACVEPKQYHDVSGGYNRFDIFQLSVNRSAQRPATFSDEPPVSSKPNAEPDDSPALPGDAC